MDALTTITKIINSPPGQLAAGGVLAGIVWKFFERVEAVLTDQTKLEIAVWLVGVKVGQKVEPWPETFARVFDRVLGQKHLSWTCFWRSAIASYSALLFTLGYYTATHWRSVSHEFKDWAILLGLALILNVPPDYLSLLVTRKALHLMETRRNTFVHGGLILADLIITSAIALAVMAYGGYIIIWWHELVHNSASLFQTGQRILRAITFVTHHLGSEIKADLRDGLGFVWLYPAFFTSIWLWLYAGSGFLLKAARRFDIGFDWFNRHFDIEKKPLQSIGLVAGALVAVVYWTAVTVSRMVG